MSPLVTVLASLLALIVAMGVGRFSLTPQLPLLLGEGQFDLTTAGLVAAANYLGYLVGAFDALRAGQAHQARWRLMGGLWGCVALTVLSAWAHGPWEHGALRFAAGVTSAWTFVLVSAASQRVALQAGMQRLGGLVFAGPSLGMLLTGLIALASNLYGQGSSVLWLLYGGLGLALALLAAPALPAPVTHPLPATRRGPAVRGLYPLLASYTLVGLGYVIPATFLSQLASSRFQGSWLADLFWPGYGLMTTLGVVLACLWHPTPDGTRRWLVRTLWLQALGALACLLPGATGLVLGVLLCGTPYLASMVLTIRHAHGLDPMGHGRNIGLLTVGFAAGQLGGPLLAALSSHLVGGLGLALAGAGVAFVAAGLLILAPASRPVAAASDAVGEGA